MSKKITNYGAEDEKEVDPDIERKDPEIDNEVGVAVVFDEEEQEEEDDDEDEDEDATEAPEDANKDDELIIGGGASGTGKGEAKVDKDIVSLTKSTVSGSKGEFVKSIWILSQQQTKPLRCSPSSAPSPASETAKISSWISSSINPSMLSPNSSKIAFGVQNL